jgi:hypothetical protein
MSRCRHEPTAISSFEGLLLHLKPTLTEQCTYCATVLASEDDVMLIGTNESAVLFIVLDETKVNGILPQWLAEYVSLESFLARLSPVFSCCFRIHFFLLHFFNSKIFSIMPPKRVKKVMTIPINVIFGHLQVSPAAS